MTNEIAKKLQSHDYCDFIIQKVKNLESSALDIYQCECLAPWVIPDLNQTSNGHWVNNNNNHPNIEHRLKAQQIDTKYIFLQSYSTDPADIKWPSKDELKLIGNYLDHNSITRVSERLGRSELSENANEEKRFEALCAWTQSNKLEWTQLHGELVSALKDTNTSGKYVLSLISIAKLNKIIIAFDLLARLTQACPPNFV